MNYTIKPKLFVSNHAAVATAFLEDIDRAPDELSIRALVASGDCFEMIASNLDQIKRNLGPDDFNRYQLEHLVRILLYMQQQYAIVKKYR